MGTNIPLISFDGQRRRKQKRSKWENVETTFPINKITSISLINNSDSSACNECEPDFCPLDSGEVCHETNDFCHPDEEPSYIELETDEYIFHCGYFYYYSQHNCYKAANEIIERIISGKENVKVDLYDIVEEWREAKIKEEIEREEANKQEFWSKFNKPATCEGCPILGKRNGLAVCRLGFTRIDNRPLEECLRPTQQEKFNVRELKYLMRRYGRKPATAV